MLSRTLRIASASVIAVGASLFINTVAMAQETTVAAAETTVAAAETTVAAAADTTVAAAADTAVAAVVDNSAAAPAGAVAAGGGFLKQDESDSSSTPIIAGGLGVVALAGVAIALRTRKANA